MGLVQEQTHRDRPADPTRFRFGAPRGLETEAHRLASRVWATPTGGLAHGIQRHPGPSSGAKPALPPSVLNVLAETGAPLDTQVRSDVEQRFGWNFSGVRVHLGPSAAQSAQDVRAHAYTVGQHIVFGRGQYLPGTDRGRQVLGHELTHVVQQRDNAGSTAADWFQPLSFDDVLDVSEIGAGVVVPSIGQRLVHEHRQLLTDAYASIKESPQHVLEFFQDEVLRTIQEHWLKIILVSGGILAAEWGVGVLLATPEPTLLTKVIAAILQIVIVAFLAYFAATEVKGAYDEGGRWLAAVRSAEGDPKKVTEASRSFVRMVWHIVMVVLAVAGLRARIKGAALPKGTAPPPSSLAGASDGASVTPISSHPRFQPRTAPTSTPGSSGSSAFGGGGTARQLAPAEQPLPQPAVAPEPVLAPAAAAGPKLAPSPGIQVAPAVGAGLSVSQTAGNKQPRPPFVLRLPPEKASYIALFRTWVGPDVNRNLRSDPAYDRGNPAQLERWHRAHRIGGSDAIPAEVYERGHRLGLTGAEGERRIRVPNWARSGRSMAMEVDHIIELQITPPSFREYFNSMANYELLDRTSNGTAGPRLRANIAAERAIQIAHDPNAAGQVLPFDRVETDGGGTGERWTSNDVQSGAQLDALPQ